MQKKILAIHDISCIGRCSLTVALPILSAAGIETCVLPTAVLSTHTGEFKNYTFRDLTNDLPPICNHWKSLNISFESIYSGYLGSYEQIAIVEQIIDELTDKKSFIIIDPVMGDNGKLYSSLTKDFAKGFKNLIKKADLITPNLTEASLLLDIPYPKGNYNKKYIEDVLKKLSDLGPKKVVLTGVSFLESQLGCAVFDREDNSLHFIFEDKVDGFFHGTGDVFSSYLVASILNNNSLYDSVKNAVEFTARAIRNTKRSDGETRYGVDFEESLTDFGFRVKK